MQLGIRESLHLNRCSIKLIEILAHEEGRRDENSAGETKEKKMKRKVSR